jgi:hypothetical protein
MTTVLPLLLALLVPGILAGRQTTQAPPKGSCVDESRQAYSGGALRKVAGQIQKCAAAQWIIDEMNGPKDPKLEKAKPCEGVMKQSYAAGVLRPVGEKPQGEKIERCDDGKWVAHVVKG